MVTAMTDPWPPPHCSRCKRDAPPYDDDDFVYWEPSEDGELLICPGCMTAIEEDGAVWHFAEGGDSPLPLLADAAKRTAAHQLYLIELVDKIEHAVREEYFPLTDDAAVRVVGAVVRAERAHGDAHDALGVLLARLWDTLSEDDRASVDPDLANYVRGIHRQHNAEREE